MPVIMGTAGHIDHGKTTLVKALTGIDCDRLVEERKRGITIELGFAFLDLEPDLRLGIIDVPGHERFVKNMVAGAAGIDFVVLVIAADEGVMPQTREHLDICSLLGIKTGLIALTKIDMVDEEWLELVQEDIHEALQGSSLEDAPFFPVSAHTGQGLPELKQALAALSKEFAPGRRTDLFRLPIDRVFTMRGHGTVVTGTGLSGKLSVGDEILVYPQQAITKVRGLQVHGKQCEQAQAGLRTAVNLAGMEVDDLQRGQVLAHADTLFPSNVWELQINCLASSRKGLKHRKEVHFHHGTKEVLARIYLLDRDVLEPGEEAVCQVRFQEPMIGVFNDRCIIRSFSPLQTIAGARILNPLGRKIKRFSPQVGLLKHLALTQDEDLILAQLNMAGRQGLSLARLRIMTDMETKSLQKILQLMGGRQQAFLIDKDERVYIAGEQVLEQEKSLLQFMQKFHADQPMRQGISRSELESGWGRELSSKFFHFLLERKQKGGQIIADQDVLRLAEHKVSLASDQAQLRKLIVDQYGQAGLTPPKLKVIQEELGLSTKEVSPVMRLLQEQRELIKISEDFYFSSQAIADLENKVRGFFATQDELGPADFRDLTGLTRKFAIPLLEYLDKAKITIRVGDKRRLRG